MTLSQIKYHSLYVTVLLCFCLSSLLSLPLQAQTIASNLAPHQSGELLVKLNSSETIYKFKFSDSQNLQELINYYSQKSDVTYVEPNYTYTASLEPLDAYYTRQNHLFQTQANKAWNITTGSTGVTIAIIDSGVDINHPDLKNNIWTNPHEIPENKIDDDENGYTDDVHGWDFLSESNDPRPKLTANYNPEAIKHGTVVAGIAAAEGGTYEGVVGLTWRSKIMPLRVLNSEGTGDTFTVARAIDYARLQGADIINLSFIGSGKSLTLEATIERANNAGILVVAAAGNEVNNGINIDNEPEYPIGHDGPNGENWVLGVTSVDKNDRLASFANYGKKYIDLAAPGVSLFSTVYYLEGDSEFGKKYEEGWTGTSVSAPQVAGAAALIKSVQPELSLNQIKNLLINNTDNIDAANYPVFTGLLGSGRLNVYNSLSKALDQAPAAPSIKDKIITSPAQSGGPHIRIFKKETLLDQFFAHDEQFRGNLSIAAGDVDADGQTEIVVGLGAGTYPWIKIFDDKNILENKITAYAESFRGGIEVALGDINGDHQLEIITAAGPGGGPHVRIFSNTGQLLGQFFAFPQNERTGLEITAADVNADGSDEIIVTRHSGLPQIKIFNNSGELLNQFIAYESFWGGAHLTAGDLDGDGYAEIITGPGSGGGPRLKVFDKNGNLLHNFMVYSESFHGGVYVATGDIDADGLLEIITGAGPTGGPQVRVFDITGKFKFQFFAYDETFRGGVRIASEK